MRRSTVLSLAPQLLFLGLTIKKQQYLNCPERGGGGGTMALVSGLVDMGFSFKLTDFRLPIFSKNILFK